MAKMRVLAVLLIVTMLTGLIPFTPPVKAVAADNSLMLWYKFNEGSGTTVTDYSGNNRNGTLNGGYTWGTAANGSRALELDGSSGFVQMPNGILTGVTDITVTTSVYLDTANADPAWVYTFGSTEYAGAPGTTYFALLEDGGGNLRSTISLNRWENEQNTAKRASLTKGVWKNVAFTLSGTTGTLYEDGVVIAQTTNVTNAPKKIGDLYNYIGKPEYSADKYLKGKVSDFRIYNRALSSSEVKNVWIESLNDTDAVTTVKGLLDLGDLSAVKGNVSLPAAYAGASIAWTSDNQSVIRNDGTVTRPSGVNTTVNLTATITRGSAIDTKIFTATVLKSGTVYSLDSTSYTLKKNTTHATLLTVTYDDLSTANVTSSAMFRSSDTTVVSVDALGVVTGISSGNATITVTYNGQTWQVSVTVTEDLVSWYKFDETSGAAAADSSGNHRQATLVGGASWVRGEIANAVELNGSNQYVDLPDGIVSTLQTCTISTLVNLDTVKWWNRIFDFGSSQTNYMFVTPEAGNLRFAIRTPAINEQIINGTSPVPASSWHHVAVTLDGATGILYLDGVEVGRNSSMTLKPSDLGNTTSNYIGKSQFNDPLLQGRVDDFRIYNRALTSVEISTLAASSLANVAVTGVTLDKIGASSVVGGTIQLTAAVSPSNATNQVVTWTSSNPAVATVSATGLVTAVGVGNTDITASTADGGKTATCVVFVAASADELQDPEIELAKKQLVIPNAGDIRGNITLPSTMTVGTETVNITWTTDKSDVVNVNEQVNGNYDHTPPGVVTRQAADTQVSLTAHLTHGTATGTKDITITVKAKPAPIHESDYAGYLFSYFTGANRPDAEQTYFGLSQDGLHWDAMNGNDPVLTSHVGTKGVRDQFIMRSPEGDKFYLVATDLRIADTDWGSAQTSGSKSVVIWESTDLVNWSNERLVKVATDDAGNTWAPEVVYDDKTGEYVMFWASRVGSDNYAKQRIYISKTRDFYTFSKPEIWIERPVDVIDVDITKYNGTYYRFSKDETHSNILIDTSDQLLGKPYNVLSSDSVGAQQGVEGPAIFKFNGENKWCLLLDNYGGGGYFPMVSTDIASGVFRKLDPSEYRLPPGPRHGTVMPITKAEYDAVMAKWGASKPVEAPQQNPVLEYKFDETKTGNAIQDTSGNNRTGTLNGNATYVTDSDTNSQVLYLDGSDSTYAAFPQGFFDGRDTVTVSMDIKPVTVDGNFFTFAIGKDNNKYMFFRTRNTELRNAITTGSWGSEQEVKATTDSIAGKWMNIKLVVTPTSMAIYKDGRLLNKNKNVNISMSDLGRDLLAYLGKSFYNDPYFKGYFDNIKVYNRALTDQEIESEFGITDDSVKIISADDVTMTTTVGQAPQLPSNVKVRYSNNTTGTVPVTWDAIDPHQYANPGAVTVQGSLYDNEYENPLIMNRADPYIYKHTDGYYYFTASYTDGSEGHNNVGMYQYDRIILRRATTIQGLATAEEKVIYTKAPINGNQSPHVWAPEIHYMDGNWYIYYAATISNTDIWQIRPQVLMCPGNLDPLVKENWQYMGQMQKTNLSDMAFNGFSLDATTFEHNGTRYLVWAQIDSVSNLYIARMKDPLTIDTNAVKISSPLYDWEKHGYEVNEGPSVLKKNGKIFISYSASATDALYCLGLLTASDTSDLLNPSSWEKSPDPVFKSDAATGQYGPGHNSFTVSEDGKDDILVYHAREEEKYIGNGYEPLYDAGRHTRVQKLYWNSDGTPNFGAPVADGKVLSSVQAKVKIIVAEPSQTNPVLEYKFDETKTGNVIQDTSGNNRTGTLNGNATYVTDSDTNSQVLYLDGSDGTYAAFPHGFFDRRDSVTVSMDIKPVTVDGNFFTFAIGKDNNKYMFFRTRNTELRNAITTGSWGSEQEVKAATDPIAGKWMNIKLVVTPTSMAIYKDGRLLSKNNHVNIAISNLGEDLLAYLGKSFYNDPYFKGYFDNIKVYNRALTETEIAQEFNITDIPLIKGASADGYSIVTTKADAANHKATVYFSRSNSTKKDLKQVPLTYVLSEGCTMDGTNGQTVDLSNPVSVTIHLPDQSTQVWTVQGVFANNPALGGQFADPDIDVFNGKFYIYPTTDGFEGWNGTQFHVFSSENMMVWKDEGVILDAEAGKDVPWSIGSAWAPTIEEKNGKYYFYFCAKRQDGASLIGVAAADRPTGPFIAQSTPLITPEIVKNAGITTMWQTIDPSIFTDDDGTSYMTFGNGSPAIVQLNDDMVSLKPGTMRSLTGATDFRESMVVIKRNGLYHFTWTCDDAGSENYHVNYGTSSNLNGQIDFKYTLLAKDTSKDILGTGHQSIVKVPGKDEYYIAYHRFVTPLGQYTSGFGFHRETSIDKLEFNANGLMKVVTPTLEGITQPVIAVPVTGITVTGGTTVEAGKTLQMNASVTPENAADKTVTWSVVNGTGQATIDTTGLLTANGAGTVIVKAIANDGSGVVGECDITITAKPSPTPTSTPTSTPAQPEPTRTPGKVEVAPPVVDQATGTATATVDSAALDKALQESNVALVEIPKAEGANSFVIRLPAPALASTGAAKIVKLKTKAADLAVPTNMLEASELVGADKVDIAIGKADTSKLDSETKAAIGERPVIELNLKVDGTTRSWSNPNAPVTVTIPYTPTAAELADPEHITVWYIDGNGKAVAMPTAKYDPESGKITFITTHFSRYAVTYVNDSFSDINNYLWAKRAIEVMASKGVINGVAADRFAPDSNITRADFVFILVKALGLSAKTDSNFAGVRQDAYYTDALAVAKKLGIATGVGDNRFNPDEKISRQDLMILIDRAMKINKKELAAGSDADLAQFEDHASVAPYAVQSVSILIKNGIVTGDGAKINPLGNATRAEAVVLIYRIYNK
ncbi:family 43 glycosylhydrolase [Paenibacillus andongensis]|uniref:family 43 glycosylhydrolase n=1 Tax=Paenibacillus andongensis TaxID=2975482 RepID=UPI0021BAB847|nr:family 43 glycosylhydrolase [Paenibacillus andongensis]